VKRPFIRARAPLRISFAGGGTDVPPFPVLQGGCVLSATINRYAYGSLTPRPDDRVSIESVDFGATADLSPGREAPEDGRFDLVKAAVRRFGGAGSSGYDMVLRSDVPPGSGLGSSSTMMVALTGLLAEHHGMPLDEYETARMAHAIERDDLGISGGLQDHYAATFGGFNFIEFGERVIVNPLRMREEVMHELELSLMLCFTDITRASSRVIDDQSARVTSGSPDTIAGLQAQRELAVTMKSALLRGELREFGALLDDSWKQKQRLSPLISNSRIEELYELAKQNGALGGKVTGAGGGGFILFYCDFPSKHRVAQALENAGASIMEFSFDEDGLTTWRA
jgi:D-glycero-alpha-D-manno-heptose-7-phosphate kinase